MGSLIALLLLGAIVVGILLWVLSVQRHRTSATPSRSAPPSRATTRNAPPGKAGTDQTGVRRTLSTASDDSLLASQIPGGIPDELPLKVKGFFFSRSELAFFQTLESVLPYGYRVFPNVRLNDLFLITAPAHQRQGTYARLRDKHVDFLIVALPDHRPVLALELDGPSHDNATQQYRDAVKDVAFRSAGLPLLRLRTDEAHTPKSLEALLQPHVGRRIETRRTVA